MLEQNEFSGNLLLCINSKLMSSK